MIQEVFSSIRVVKAFAREDYEQKRLETESLESIDLALKARSLKAKLSPMVEIIVAASAEVEALEVAKKIAALSRTRPSKNDVPRFGVLYRTHTHRDEVAKALSAVTNIPLDIQTVAANRSSFAVGPITAVAPPSTATVAPVMNDDSSLRRKATTRAISSTSPSRPIGCS